MEGLIPGIMAANQGLPVQDVLDKAYNAAIAINPEIKSKVEARAENKRIEGPEG